MPKDGTLGVLAAAAIGGTALAEIRGGANTSGSFVELTDAGAARATKLR